MATDAELTSPSSADNVHRNVARLSISVEDALDTKREFIAGLMSDKAAKMDSNSNNSAIDEEDDVTSSSNDNKLSSSANDISTEKFVSKNDNSNSDESNTTIDNEKLDLSGHVRSKRRRSSVQQTTTQLRKKKFLIAPKFQYSNRTGCMDIGDLQSLILTALTSSSDVKKMRSGKFVLSNASSVEKVLLVTVPGLSSDDFNIPKLEGEEAFENSKIPFLNENFKKVLEFRHPGNRQSLYNFDMTFNKIRLNNKQKSKRAAEFARASKEDAIVITDLLMTAPFMFYDKRPYPIHPDTPYATTEMIEKFSDYVDTVKFDHDGSHIFAIDCEMCRAESGHVLTRISVIDFTDKVIIDELVKPEEEIIDYATKYSGITEEMLKDVTTTLKDIQEKLLKTISSEDIIIGHSLESDLHALKMRHPRIVDTAIIYDHPMGPPAKASLKSLMKLHFNKDIQTGEAGHDSIEDSQSCLDLVKLKITKGLTFGKSSEQYIYEKILTMNKHYLIDGEKKPKSSLIVDFKKGFERPDLAKHASCSTRKEIVQKTLENMADHELIFVNIGAPYVHQEENEDFSDQSYKPYEMTPEEREAQLLEISEGLNQLYDRLPINSMMIVVSAVARKREITQLQKQKRDFEKDFDNPDVKPWTIEDSNLLDSKIFKARQGTCLIKIKDANMNTDEDAIENDNK